MSGLPDPFLPDLRVPGVRCGASREPGFPEPCPERLWAALRRPGEVETWRKVFPGTARHVADARRLARVFLNDTSRADDAAWITGELAANAARHTRSGEDGGTYVLELCRVGELARIVVCDLGGGGRPVFTRPPAGLNLTEHGYGLPAVARLARGTGVRGCPAVGHAVWAELLLGT
ncbi:ATP-binding protein [Thermopolyspora sp. NPDC052614]|uniref:ATP-binding protein n=1 Tax=Thermopolyspora sp. NPDC052614 TaxID=3155682 RepID=UPI00342C3DAD